MNNRKTLGIALLAIGAILLIASLVVDLFWSGGMPGFGYKQILGIVAGAVLAGVGFVFYSRK